MLAVLCFILTAVPIPYDAAESGLGYPGDGLGLAPTPVVVSPIGVGSRPSSPRGAPTSRDAHRPWIPTLPAVAIAAAGTAIPPARRRRDREPLYVLVHGNGGSRSDFDPLLRAMDVAALTIRS